MKPVFLPNNISPKLLTILAALLIGFFCFLETDIIPPLQSPDESDHLKRAYWLSKGEFLLKTPPGEISGGFLDSGLENYIEYYSRYDRNTDKKVTQSDLNVIRNFQWTANKIFTAAAGTGYYFPILYTPQAIGLFIGEYAHLSIDRSYRLARLMSSIVACFIIIAAFAISAPNALVLALLTIPMTLFQIAAANLDGMATAVTILALAAFCQIKRLASHTPPALLYTLSISVTLVAACRLHALPILLLPFMAWIYTRRKNVLWQALGCTAFATGWTLLAMKMTVSNPHPETSVSAKLLGIFLHPLHFAHLIFNTITDPDKQNFYIYSFLGNLGWLDTRFSSQFYEISKLLLLVIALLCLPWKSRRRETWISSGILASMGLASCLLIFTALYLAWTPPHSPEIEGVQGRYFLIPALFLAYGLGEMKMTRRSLCAFSLFSVLFVFSTYSMISVLLTRYYIGS